MSTPQLPACWWHLILTTKGSWLHGDPRGFHSRDHRIHSSGDYKNPPPMGEHEGLHHYQKQHSSAAILIPKELRPVMGARMLRKMHDDSAPCQALAVVAMHAHAMIRLTDDYGHANRYAGKLKQVASRAVTHDMPGDLWADGGKPVRISDDEHYVNAFHYILDHVHEGAWVWHPRLPLPWEKGDEVWEAGVMPIEPKLP